MNSRLVPFVGLVFLLACSATGQEAKTDAAPSNDQVVATIDGEPLHVSDLGINGELIRLRQEEYQAKVQGLESKIADILLRRDAEEKGLDFDTYIVQEIGDKVEGPTEEQIQRLYDQQKARIGRPLEDVRSQIVRVLRQQMVRKEHDALVARLREGVDIKVNIAPPRVEVVEETLRVRGPEDAPIQITEFSDFQCPFCRQVQPALAELQDRYGDQIRWSFKDLPLNSIHPQAQKAAEAARCAGEQGKFWEFRAAMFESTRITAELFHLTAEEIGVDSSEFRSCLDSDRHRDGVVADSEEAQSLGITGTPAFVINGVLLSGAQPLENFVRVIDMELDRVASN